MSRSNPRTREFKESGLGLGTVVVGEGGDSSIVIVIGRAGDIVRPGLEISLLRHRAKLELWPSSLGKAGSAILIALKEIGIS